VTKFAPTEEETIVVGTAGVNEIQIYDIKDGRDELIGMVENKPKGLYSVDFASDGRTVAYCTEGEFGVMGFDFKDPGDFGNYW